MYDIHSRFPLVQLVARKYEISTSSYSLLNLCICCEDGILIDFMIVVGGFKLLQSIKTFFPVNSISCIGRSLLVSMNFHSCLCQSAPNISPSLISLTHSLSLSISAILYSIKLKRLKYAYSTDYVGFTRTSYTGKR